MFSWSNITENEDGEEKEYPEEISILALRGTVAFPHIIMPLVIGLEHSIELIDDAIDGDEYIGLAVSQAPEKENPKPEEVHPTGVIATIHRRLRSKDGSLQIIVQGVERFKVTEWTQKKPYLKAKIAIVHDTVDDDKLLEIEALRRRTIDLSREIVRFMPQVPEEAVSFLESADDPHMLLYTVAANTRMEQPLKKSWAKGTKPK